MSDSDDSEENDTRSISLGDCSDSEMHIAQRRNLPTGVRETESGTWQVQIYFQGSSRKIGTFQTLVQATTANEIGRSMLKKDKGLQLSAKERERNFKLAKEAALTMVMTGVKRGRGRPRKGKGSKLPQGVSETFGKYKVEIYYQGRQRYIGIFLTLEQATLANEIARNMIEKDKGLQLSAEECERNLKLAKEAAFTTAMPDRKKKLPKGVRETISGSWEVRVRYQSSQRYIGTFRTLEQATLANEIARNIFKKDEGLQLPAEECERNIKLAREAVLADVHAKRSKGRQKKTKKTVYEETVIRDSSKEEPSENRDGGLSRHGRKQKLSKKKVDSLDIDEEIKSSGCCQPTPTKRKRAGRPRSTKSVSVSVVRDYRLCSIAGCTKHAQKGGVCCLHGGKVTRRLCTYKGSGIGADGQCPNVVKRGGLCRRHGAFDLPDCSDPFYKRVALKDDDYCTER